MKYLILFISVLILHKNSASQDSTLQHATPATLHLSALGALKYPGIRAGIDYPVKNKVIERKKRNHTKIIFKDRFVTVNYGFYYHPDFHTAHFLHAGYQFRRTVKSGWFVAFEPQLGVNRTVIQDAVYTVDESGKVSKKKAAGNFYLSPLLSFNLGKELTTPLPFSVYSKLSIYTCLPYNNFVYARLLLEAGIAVPIHKLIN